MQTRLLLSANKTSFECKQGFFLNGVSHGSAMECFRAVFLIIVLFKFRISATCFR